MISQFYGQFSRSSRILGHFWKFRKISNSQNTNISYIILKRVISRFQIYNLFREKFKFSVFTKALKNFTKYIIAFIFSKFKYFAKKINIWNLQITRFKTIFDMFVFQEFETSKNGLNSDYFAKIAHAIAKSKYFPNIFNDSDSPINSLSDDI